MALYIGIDLHSTSSHLCVIDEKGCFKRVNPALHRRLGYAEEDLLGHPFVPLIHPPDRRRVRPDLPWARVRLGASGFRKPCFLLGIGFGAQVGSITTGLPPICTLPRAKEWGPDRRERRSGPMTCGSSSSDPDPGRRSGWTGARCLPCRVHHARCTPSTRPQPSS